MALTLAHQAQIETNPLRKYVIMNLLKDARIMEVIPWTDVNSFTSVAVRWRTLPSVAFRKINAGYTPSEGQTEQVWESVYVMGGEIKYDRLFEKVKGSAIVDFKKMHTNMKLKSMALNFNDYLINGDHGTDADGFEGYKKRVTNMPSRQLVGFAGASAAALDPTANVASGRTFFNKLEEAHYKTNQGNVNAIFANEGIYYGVGAVARSIQASGGNYLDVTTDSFDRDITTFKGAPIIDMGLKIDQSTEIITETEVAGDAGADSTSVYMVSFDEMQGVVGIQLPPGLEVYDPLNGGEQESTPTKLLRIEWALGLAGFGSYGLTRAWNVEGAANWT